MERDPVRDLNNFLQGHPRGNLTPYFSWSLDKDGPDHQKIHYAIAKLNGTNIGSGQGFAIGNAKRDAATRALQYLNSVRVEDLIWK
ncbi:hypothetical protein F5148DRAFT_1199118 [Russula earlei]|uniref:Uncharacterized protein n=1 Tax=Russula earlei TaxID=71964 RepID=A0ACC0UAN1_9AGAM|nr:hypothetical protein F5148DRAFT_1199118 [Russula earlei]